MNLNISQWKTFTIKKLFPKLVVGSANQGMLSEGSDCFYVGAKRNDNGVMLHCQRDEDLILKGNCIIFICNGEGSVGYANYMDRDFIGTTDIVAGYNENLNYLNGVFLATVISKERPKYSFGRKWKTHLKDTEIKLPIQHNIDGSVLIDDTHEYSDEGYVPDWEFMEKFIRSLHFKKLKTQNLSLSLSLDISKMRHFFLHKLCSITMGNKLDFNKMSFEEPSINFVGRSAFNNGVKTKVDYILNKTPYKAGCMTVALGGSIGSTHIQTEDFYTSQNVSVLEFDSEISVAVKLFISTMLMNECTYKYYPFGRELNKHIRTDFGFYLPIKFDNTGEPVIDLTHRYSDEGYVPDWQFMENYIKSLPYGDRI